MYCTHCGNEIDNNALVCMHCGVPTQKMKQAAANGGQAKVTNNMGLAGFIVGLLSLWLGAVFTIPSIIGLVFSIIGISNAKNCNSANGFAIAGLVLSIISTVLWSFIWLIMFGASLM